MTTPGSNAQEKGGAGQQAPGERWLATARALMATLFGPVSERAFAVVWWNGTEDRPERPSQVSATVAIKRPGVLREVLLPPREVAFAEAYLKGDIEVAGDVAAISGQVRLLAKQFRSPLAVLRLVPMVLALPRDRANAPLALRENAPRRHAKHSQQQDMLSIRFHYDIGNDFYQPWLDRNMVYSCGYFPTGAEDIHQAQEAKLDYICRKLGLKAGEKLLDIGCGWGGLVRWAASHYGCEALGITLSAAQARYARQCIADDGLADRCRVEVLDYRALPETQPFDKVASVGMVEHVGREQLRAYFSQVHSLLKPGGLFFNQGIVHTHRLGRGGLVERVMARMWGEGTFSQRYVFPDGDIVTLGGLVTAAEAAGFESRDIENLREHYALTVGHWIRRLEAHQEAVVAAAGEPAYRVWHLYLSMAAHLFEAGDMGLAQMLLSKQAEDGTTGLPLTRRHLYGK